MGSAAPSVGRGSKSCPGCKSLTCHLPYWSLWPFLRGRPRVRISPVSLAPKPGDFCLIFDAILTPKTNYDPITPPERGWGYLKWPQLSGASLRAGHYWGDGAVMGGGTPPSPWYRIPSCMETSHPVPAELHLTCRPGLTAGGCRLTCAGLTNPITLHLPWPWP